MLNTGHNHNNINSSPFKLWPEWGDIFSSPFKPWPGWGIKT
jgi:hypothetical protein